MNKKTIITCYLIFILNIINLYSSIKYNETLNETIIDAVRKNKSEEVASLLKRLASPNVVDEDSFTLLHLSVLKNYLEIAELLIENGANPNVGDSCGDTPLHIASWNEYEDMVKLLIKGGANASALNDNGANPLHLEIYIDPKCAEIRDALLKAGSKIDTIKKYAVARTYYDETKTETESFHNEHIILAAIVVITFHYYLKYIFIFCW